MQSQVLVLEEEKKALDAKVAQEHEQLEAATALHKVLSDKIQQVTTSLEQKCKDEVTKAEQKMSELQVKAGALPSPPVLCSSVMHTPAVWLACLMTNKIVLQLCRVAFHPLHCMQRPTAGLQLCWVVLLNRRHCRAVQQP